MATISISNNGEVQSLLRSSRLHTECQEELTAKEIYTLHGDHRGSQVVSLKGNLWITQQGDPVDYIIQPGESFRLVRRGKVLIQGLSSENCFSLVS